MWILLLLVALNLWSLLTLKEPENLKKVKELYTTFLDNVPEKYPQLRTRTIVTGFQNKNRELGYNVNKGYEIGLCLDGTPNQMFHVLMHELAHSTVDEYSHSEQFWKNFQEIKDHCVKLGIYQEIPERTKFCGKYIRD
jgi:predicted metal-dependent hydrolase